MRAALRFLPRFCLALFASVLAGCASSAPNADELAGATRSRTFAVTPEAALSAAEKACARMNVFSMRDPAASNRLIVWKRWTNQEEENAALAGNIAVVGSLITLQVLAGGHAVPPELFSAQEHILRGTVTAQPCASPPDSTTVSVLFLCDDRAENTESYSLRFWMLLTEALPGHPPTTPPP